MKIHLFGKGKMGKMIESQLPHHGHQLTSLEDAECCIDFSHPSVLFKNLQLSKNKGLVIGTTGWEDQFDEVKSFVLRHEMRVVAAPNFSIGIHLLLEMLQNMAEKISIFDDYDIVGVESHHKQKIDAPSGTALAIMKTIKERSGKECPFSSIRAGHIPGEHSVIFDSPFDTITITHTARSREGFARGAILAAEWVSQRKGFFTFNEVMHDIYSSHHSV